MGWYKIADENGYIGDEPMDVFSTALSQIANTYIDRFGRRPTVQELTHTFKVVLAGSPDDYIYDTQTVQTLWDQPSPVRLPVVPDDFEASWSEIPEPDGRYYVTRISSGEDVLRCTLEVTGPLLQVNYEILEDALTDADCRTLILSTILKEFTDDFYADQVEQISFCSLRSGESTVMPYPK